MNLAKKIPLVAMLPFIMSITSSCNKGPQTFEVDIVMPNDSGKAFCQIDLNCKGEDMKKHGYEYGDIVEITAKSKDGSKTKTMILPYVTNYNEAGTFGPCLCDYESKGRPLNIATGFKTAGIAEANYFAEGKCEIKIKSKGGYKEMRDLASVTTKLTYDECGRDNIKFANTRDVINIGDIGSKVKPNTLYRGSSPIANSKNKERYSYADGYLAYHEVKYDISLSLTDEELHDIYFDNPTKGTKAETTIGKYTKETLYNETAADSKLYTVSLGSDFFRIGYKKGGTITASVFNKIAENTTDSSFYVHCNEGKDRTGFVIMILEALCGVTVNDLVADYMKTFENYYNITELNNKDKYNAMANLTCYRNIYSFMIANEKKLDDGNKIYDEMGKLEMLSFDSKKEVDNLIEKNKSNTKYLQECAVKYLNAIGVEGDLSSGNVKTLHDKFAVVDK